MNLFRNNKNEIIRNQSHNFALPHNNLVFEHYYKAKLLDVDFKERIENLLNTEIYKYDFSRFSELMIVDKKYMTYEDFLKLTFPLSIMDEILPELKNIVINKSIEEVFFMRYPNLIKIFERKCKTHPVIHKTLLKYTNIKESSILDHMFSVGIFMTCITYIYYNKLLLIETRGNL